jgi:hypothetical protein
VVVRRGWLVEWVVVSCLLAAGLAAAWRPPSPRGEQEPLWEESWSERYPGCVATVLWPATERPVAVVTRDPAGHLARVPVDEVGVSDPRAVGACRRP